MNPVVIVACLALALPLSALGHGGEDHSTPAPQVSRPVAPRAVAVSEEFEAVVVLEDKQIVLYLDQFASNAPVPGAKVEIEGAGVNAVAAETAPGVYALAAPTLAVGKYPLTITIEAGDSADLLSATLEIAALPVAEEQSVTRGWLWPALMLLLLGPVLWLRRRARQTEVWP